MHKSQHKPRKPIETAKVSGLRKHGFGGGDIKKRRIANSHIGQKLCLKVLLPKSGER